LFPFLDGPKTLENWRNYSVWERKFYVDTILTPQSRSARHRVIEVEKFLDTPVKRYSSGMYVRLAFAVAAHLEPEILIVDEVLAVGDTEFQKKCLGKMEDVSHSGRTVLFVSHNMAAITALTKTSVLLQAGNCVFLVKPKRQSGNILARVTRKSRAMKRRQNPGSRR
jgi:lipopolysaccharide transport system ATP-binding protein